MTRVRPEAMGSCMSVLLLAALAACARGGVSAPATEGPAGPLGQAPPQAAADDPGWDGWTGPRPGEPSPPEWILAVEILERIRCHDAGALQKFRITAAEYRDFIIPEADPEDMDSMAFHWLLLDAGSLSGISKSIDHYGDRDLDLLEIIPTRGVEVYPSFTMLTRVEFKVRDAKDGKEYRIRIIGSIVLRDGRAKVLSFKD